MPARITDIASLEAYMQSTALAYCQQYCYLDADIAAISQRLSQYFTASGTAQLPTCFFSIFEGEFLAGTPSHQLLLRCQLMYLVAAQPHSPADILAARNTTYHLALQVLGRITQDQEELWQNSAMPTYPYTEVEDGKYQIQLPAEPQLMPESDVAGLGAYGWSMPIDVILHVNPIMYP